MYYSQEKLMDYCMEALTVSGVRPKDAKTIAQVLISADLRGVHSHGCIRMEGYVECLKAGGIKADASPVIDDQSATYAIVNAQKGLGIPASVFAMELAIQKARISGLAIVNVHNSHHHGACGYYSMMCAAQGLIGLAMSTGDIIMAATGSASRAIGNNPFSYALPAGKYRAICYDIAMSAVAAGKVSIAADEGKMIPAGWLLDPEGNPTTDPNDYDQGGALVPFGGYKGYGLSVMVESLAGILSGAAMLGNIHAWNKDPDHGGDVGHCFIAINPGIVNPHVNIAEQAEAMIDQLTSAKKAPGVDRIFFPGQIENEIEEHSMQSGIKLPLATEHALEKVACITKIRFEPLHLAHEQ